MTKASINFDRIAERYEETRGGLARGKRVAASLWPYLRTTRPVLELGVGTGVVARAMQAEGYSVTGVDLSTQMLARARGRAARLVAADIGRLPFADASFEQAASAWVLHLVGDPAAVLAELARVLTPGARYLDVPGSTVVDGTSPIREALGDMEERLRARAWSQARTADGLIELAQGAGFHVIETRLSEPFTLTARPSEVIARIEERTYSYLWDLDDETWRDVVEPALDRLRALPDEEVARVARDRIIVMRRG